MLCIEGTKFFGVNNFGYAKGMRLNFLSKQQKFHINTVNFRKYKKKCSVFRINAFELVVFTTGFYNQVFTIGGPRIMAKILGIGTH